MNDLPLSHPPPSSVKAMLLLIDCKDKIVLERAISHISNSEKGAQKPRNGVRQPLVAIYGHLEL